MMLDTGFVIDVMNNEASAVNALQKFLANKQDYKISSPVVFELWVGVALSKKPEAELEKIRQALSDFSVLPLTRVQAEKAGELHGSLMKSGKEIDVVDSMIAATAILENESVITRNVKHFSRVRGLRVESY